MIDAPGWPYRGLAADEVHLATMAFPIALDLAADVVNAIGKVAKKHGLIDAAILIDGSGRIVARRPS